MISEQKIWSKITFPLISSSYQVVMVQSNIQSNNDLIGFGANIYILLQKLASAIRMNIKHLARHLKLLKEGF